MTIRYNKTFGIVLAVIGGVGITLRFLLLMAGARQEPASILFSIFPPIIAFIVGLRMLNGAYVTIADDEIVIHALLGPAKKSYPIDSLADIKMEDGRIYVRTLGEERKLGISRGMSNRDDWNALEAAASNARVATSRPATT